MDEHLFNSIEFIAPLGASVRQQANQFSQQHADPQKAQQVYSNTLAVSAVAFYLRCMGVEVDVTTSESWNPVSQSLLDVADLTLPSLGSIECRPVLPGELVMRVPLEACVDRIGYIAVGLDSSGRSATLLGFTPSAGTGEVPLQHLRSLDQFLVYLERLQPEKPSTRLSQWLQGTIEAGWRSIDRIVGSNQALTLQLRTRVKDSETTIQQAKLLDFGLQLGQESVVLLVAVAPEGERKIGISIQVHPVPGTIYLPPDLSLRLQSETGETLQEARSRQQDNYIQLKQFRGEPGEQFEIEIALGDVKMTESFLM